MLSIKIFDTFSKMVDWLKMWRHCFTFWFTYKQTKTVSMADHTPEVLQMSPVVSIVIKQSYILRHSSAIKIKRRLITFYSRQYQVNYITAYSHHFACFVVKSTGIQQYQSVVPSSTLVILVLNQERNTVTSIFGQQHISISSNWP